MADTISITRSYMIARGIRIMILNSFGLATSTGAPWDLDEFVKKIKEDESVQNEFDVYDLKTGEMEDLGFGIVKDKPYRLIPAWLYQFLPMDVPVIPDGKTNYEMMKKTDFDPQLVLGCFKYGILPSDYVQNKVEESKN